VASGSLGFAIVGAGGAGGVHADALSRIDGARVVAVVGASPTSARAAALGARHGARHLADLDAVLADPAVDVVVLATPHPLHAQAAIAAAAAGRHVVVEKPMAIGVEECTAMIEAAERARVALSVISQRRWYPAVRRVKDAVDRGRIGEPALATIELLGWRSADYYAMDGWRGTVAGEGGGVLVNQAVHLLDLACWILGPAAEADGWVANVNHPEIDVEDSAVAIVRFERGTLATVVASNAQRPGLHGRLHVHGSNGASVGVETDRGSSFVAGIGVPSEPRNDLWTVPGEEDGPDRWSAEDHTALTGVDPASHHHELQLRDVVDAIRDHRRPAVTGEDGRTTVALMAGIAAAAARGGRQQLLAASAREAVR
jgi:UDP-N-acetyl-2-amino-2-deoxyglucuronate dehydrogenase